MDILLVLLRLLHIVAAMTWFGLGAASFFYISPASIAAGEGGLRFLKALFTRTNFSSIFAAAGGLTVLAGILLYLVGNAASHFTQTGNIVLGIGAVFGILAVIHGGASTGRTTKALAEAINQYVPDGAQPIAADALPILRQHAEKMLTDSRVSFVLMLIALIGMGSARYL